MRDLGLGERGEEEGGEEEEGVAALHCEGEPQHSEDITELHCN